MHDIHMGDPLPDTLSALLTGSPFAYTRAVAPSYFSNGQNIGPAADSSSAFAAYVQDVWKVTPRIVLNFGLRFELYTPISERASNFGVLSNGEWRTRVPDQSTAGIPDGDEQLGAASSD
jgi:hypothetical protein